MPTLPERSPLPSFLIAALFLAIAGGATLLSGCASSSDSIFAAQDADIASHFLPYDRAVPHHPDSLKAVTIVPKERRITLELEKPYEEMLRDWSASWQYQMRNSSGRSRPYRSFATLWSLDLSVASLQPEVGLSSLSKDIAQQRLDERIAEYDSTLQIDVYQFLGSPPDLRGTSEMSLDGPGANVTLRDDRGNEYRPIREVSGPSTYDTVQGQSVVYRRNEFVFDRAAEGADILRGVRELRLWVRPAFGEPYYFTWSFESDPTAASAR